MSLAREAKASDDRTMPRSLAALLVLTLSSVAQAQVDADPPIGGPPTEAAKLFEEGRAFAKAGKYHEACDKFSKSYELDRGVGTELNLADCHEHLNHFAEAWRMFDEAAQQSTSNPPRATFARERANALNNKVATIVVKLPNPTGATVTIGGHIVSPAAEIRWRANPGPIDVVVTLHGRAPFSKSQDVVGGEIVTIDVPVEAPQHVQEPAVALPVPLEPAHEAPTGRRDRTRVKIAIVLAGASGASLIASVGFALTGRSQYVQTISDGQCMKVGAQLVCDSMGFSTAQHAGTLANIGTGFGIAAIALIGAGAYVYLTAPHETILSPTVSADRVGIAVAGRF